MRESARRRVLDTLPDDALVLDVGGWAVPFPRADWMLDLGGYATRGEWGYEGDHTAERFTADTWVQRDICDREPWPFEAKQFDFAICSHTLEDVRDPIWVCQELQRVAKAGYIETPSRLEEQCYGFQGPWTGWGHHHWIVEATPVGLTFTFKHHIVHAPEYRIEHLHDSLTEDQKILSFWWEDAFAASERLFDKPADLDAYLHDFAAAKRPTGRRRALRGRR
jgi:hypothetical protein